MLDRQDYGHPDDLRRMQSLAQRIWSPDQRFHIGDLAWGRYSIPGAEAAFRTSLWEQGGEVVAWAWAELPNYLELLVDPRRGDLVPELLDWFEATADGPDLSCMVMDCDFRVQHALRDRGYRRERAGPFFTRHSRDLTELPSVVLPAGFTIEPVPKGDAERRAAAHRAGWSDFGSRVSTESYATLMQTYPYRSETDLVVVTDNGEWVASALGWYDEVNAVGLVEPVSCDPDYRRLGLARAVDVALLYAFRELGGDSAVVLPRGDEAYHAPGRLYRSIGYQPGPRTVVYSRQGDA